MVDGIVNSFLQAIKGDFMLQVIRNTLSYKYAFGAGILLFIITLIFGLSMLLTNTLLAHEMFGGLLPFFIVIWGFIITAVSSGIWVLVILTDIIRHKSHKPLETKSKTTPVKDFVVIIYTLYSLFVIYVFIQDFIIRM